MSRVPFSESALVDQRGIDDTTTTETALESIGSSCVQPSLSNTALQNTGVRSVLYSLDGSVHVDALAYRLNRSIVTLLGELRRLEQSGEIICCYRIEENREKQPLNNHNTYAQT